MLIAPLLFKFSQRPPRRVFHLAESFFHRAFSLLRGASNSIIIHKYPPNVFVTDNAGTDNRRTVLF
jgi:hypothetical protein